MLAALAPGASSIFDSSVGLFVAILQFVPGRLSSTALDTEAYLQIIKRMYREWSEVGSGTGVTLPLENAVEFGLKEQQKYKPTEASTQTNEKSQYKGNVI